MSQEVLTDAQLEAKYRDFTDEQMEDEIARLFAAMKPAKRARLKVADPATFERYSAYAERAATRGPYERITPQRRAELRHSDPERFEQLRSDWIQRGSPPCVAGEA